MKLLVVFICVVLVGLAASHLVSVVRRFEPDVFPDEVTWHTAVCKGARLVDLMRTTDEKAGTLIEQWKDRNPPSAKSEWQGDLKADLKTWGWTEGWAQQSNADMEDWYVGSVVGALGIDGKPESDGGHNFPYAVQHWDDEKKDEQGNRIPIAQQTYKVGNIEYYATGANHRFCVNRKDGVIFGQVLNGPLHAARQQWGRQPSDDELPRLRKLSDVFWGYWIRDNPNVSNLRYLWMMDVENVDTQKIVTQALHNVGKEIEKWPGVTFDMTTDEGKAILASENGSPFAWLLIQHKQQLGIKWIPKVVVFMDDLERSYSGPHLIFYVEAAPQPILEGLRGL